MVLIADSGSTKTDWILLDLKSGNRTFYEGIGLNPYYSNSKSIFEEAKRLFEFLDKSTVLHIYFYGAGCTTESNKQIISKCLSKLFSTSQIDVFNDLEGSARALCKNTKGVTCILGTGSNAAYFDGKQIKESAVSLGYLLGDEGSGNHLGKKLIHAIFFKTAPEDLIQDFQKTFNLSVEDLLIEFYHKPYPSRFLASFAPYIYQKKSHPFILDLIYKSFEEFIQLVVKPLIPNKKLPVHFTGSIAWFFKDELVYVIEKSGFILGDIRQKPIEDLSDFHLFMEKTKII